jgi:hypothetical protein
LAFLKIAKYKIEFLGLNMYDILDVIKNIDDIYENNTSLAILKDFERVLDEMDMYVYENWEDGELAYGPQVDRHWITAGFMWPREKMPNPTAAKRLIDLGCKVKYETSHVIEPRRIKSEDDIRPGTKKGKLDRHPIWIVEIQMPKKVAFDIYRGYMDKMKNENGETTIEPTTPAAPAAPAAGAVPVAGNAAPAAPVAGAAPAPTV